jgi:hypothetical protein
MVIREFIVRKCCSPPTLIPLIFGLSFLSVEDVHHWKKVLPSLYIAKELRILDDFPLKADKKKPIS